MDDNPKVSVIGSAEELMDTIFGALGVGPREPDAMTTPPTLSGPKGRAWHIDMPTVREKAMARDPAAMDDDNVVTAWLIEVPEACPSHYHSCLLFVNDLAVAGAEPWIEGATHELVVKAVIPTGSRDAMLAGDERFPISGDTIYACHFVFPDHGAACAQAEEIVNLVLAGDLVPSEAGEQAWMDRWGDAGLNPDWVDHGRLEKASGRYFRALKALEIGAAYSGVKEPRLVDPAYLRAGVDSVKISLEAVVELLLAKGVISKAEFVEANANQAEATYEEKYRGRYDLAPLPATED